MKRKNPINLTLTIKNASTVDASTVDASTVSQDEKPLKKQFVDNPSYVPAVKSSKRHDLNIITTVASHDNPINHDNPTFINDLMKTKNNNCVELAEKFTEVIAKINDPTLLYKKPCEINMTDKILGKGEFGVVYETDVGDIIKISNLLHKARIDSNKCIGTKKINNYIDMFDNANNQIMWLSNIQNKLPLHINKIIEFEQCALDKHKYDDTYVKLLADDVQFPINKYKLEKINGITLENIVNRDSEIIFEEKDMFEVYIQLIYVVTYCNLNNVYHNDLHKKNIMINKDKQNVNLNILEIGHSPGVKISLNLEDTYVPVLIDFELSLTYSESVPKLIPFEIDRINQIFSKHICDRFPNLKLLVEAIEKLSLVEYIDDLSNFSSAYALEMFPYNESVNEYIKNVFTIIKNFRLTSGNTVTIVEKSSILTETSGGGHKLKYHKYVKKINDIHNVFKISQSEVQD